MSSRRGDWRLRVGTNRRFGALSLEKPMAMSNRGLPDPNLELEFLRIASLKSDDVRIVQAINFASNAILEHRFFGGALEIAVLPAKMKTDQMPRRFLTAKET